MICLFLNKENLLTGTKPNCNLSLSGISGHVHIYPELGIKESKTEITFILPYRPYSGKVRVKRGQFRFFQSQSQFLSVVRDMVTIARLRWEDGKFSRILLVIRVVAFHGNF